MEPFLGKVALPDVLAVEDAVGLLKVLAEGVEGLAAAGVLVLVPGLGRPMVPVAPDLSRLAFISIDLLLEDF